MQDLLAMDPLLLPVFINLCPKKDLVALFKYIPPYVSTAYVSYMVSTQGWSQVEVSDVKHHLLCSILAVIGG